MKMWNFRGHSVIALGLLVTVFLFASLANATIVTPGGATVAASSIAVGGASTTLLTLGSTAFSSVPPSYAGSVNEWVVLDSNTNELDFIYQVTETSNGGGGIETMSVTNFSSTINNVGYTTGYGIAPTLPSSDISGVSQTGGAVNFDFGSGLPVGTTVDLIVQTNATQSTGGYINFNDGGVASVSGYGPAPEPGSVGLLLGGLFGVGLFVTRRFRAQQS